MPFKPTIFFLLCALSEAQLIGQTYPTIYCFPGQGSDQRIFDSLHLDPRYPIKYIEYGTAPKHSTMQSFARQLAMQIDTSQPFVLVGVSLGGMLCAEISEITHPRQTIIISSAKNRAELPLRYKMQRIVPMYKLLPGRFILASARTLQPIVEPDRNRQKATFVSMLGRKNGLYMKRSVSLIIGWDRRENAQKIIHLHGNNDHTLPIRKIKSPTYIVQEGSHMMTLTRGREIGEIVNLILSGE
jgi:pimeloyl-ACP methyl ester carboxylesterase